MSYRALKSVQSFSCRRRQEKKGKEGVVVSAQKVTQALYFTYSWGSPP